MKRNFKSEGEKTMTYKVTRDCCTSGNCIKCITARRDTPTMKPFQCIRVVQLDGLTKEKAGVVAFNFRAYNATVEPEGN